jgi:dihydroneopterin aldolase
MKDRTGPGFMTVTRKKRDDKITLSGIRIYPRLGVTAEERAAPQRCDTDLTVEGIFEDAASLDSLENSIDYSRVLAKVREVAHEGEYSLVETLAYRIVRTVLSEFPVRSVSVKVRKKPASLQDQLDFVEVDVEEP